MLSNWWALLLCAIAKWILLFRYKKQTLQYLALYTYGWCPLRKGGAPRAISIYLGKMKILSLSTPYVDVCRRRLPSSIIPKTRFPIKKNNMEDICCERTTVPTFCCSTQLWLFATCGNLHSFRFQASTMSQLCISHSLRYVAYSFCKSRFG